MTPARRKPHHDLRTSLLLDRWADLSRTLEALDRSVTAEHIHNARVAARRLRSVLRTLQADCQPLRYAELRFDLKFIGHRLGHARTSDMHAVVIDRLLASLHKPHARDERSLRTLLARMTDTEHKSIARHLDSTAWTARVARITAHANIDELLLPAKASEQEELCVLLLATIDKATKVLGKERRSTLKLHKQRIAVKNARYVFEALLPAWRAKNPAQFDAERLLTALRDFQDLLGTARDFDATAHWLVAAAIQTPLRESLLEAAREHGTLNRKLYNRLRQRCIKQLAQVRGALSGDEHHHG